STARQPNRRARIVSRKLWSRTPELARDSIADSTDTRANTRGSQSRPRELASKLVLRRRRREGIRPTRRVVFAGGPLRLSTRPVLHCFGYWSVSTAVLGEPSTAPPPGLLNVRFTVRLCPPLLMSGMVNVWLVTPGPNPSVPKAAT